AFVCLYPRNSATTFISRGAQMYAPKLDRDLHCMFERRGRRLDKGIHIHHIRKKLRTIREPLLTDTFIGIQKIGQELHGLVARRQSAGSREFFRYKLVQIPSVAVKHIVWMAWQM